MPEVMNLDFTDDKLVEMFGWLHFMGFSGETCGSCKKTANVPIGPGWFCPCRAFNAMSFSHHQTPYEAPDYGPRSGNINQAALKARMTTAEVKPSQINISSHLVGSPLNKSERETIARNIIVICRKREDSWAPFTFEEYTELCSHKVTAGERAVLDELASMGLLKLNNSVYAVQDLFVLTLNKFVVL